MLGGETYNGINLLDQITHLCGLDRGQNDATNHTCQHYDKMVSETPQPKGYKQSSCAGRIQRARVDDYAKPAKQKTKLICLLPRRDGCLCRCQPSCEPSLMAGQGSGYHYSTQIILPKNKREKSPGRLTVCVTRRLGGLRLAVETEPTSSHENCLKTRRLPDVGCTLC